MSISRILIARTRMGSAIGKRFILRYVPTSLASRGHLFIRSRYGLFRRKRGTYAKVQNARSVYLKVFCHDLFQYIAIGVRAFCLNATSQDGPELHTTNRTPGAIS